MEFAGKMWLRLVQLQPALNELRKKKQNFVLYEHEMDVDAGHDNDYDD